MGILTTLAAQRRSTQVLLEFTLIGAIGVLDFLTGYELAFSLFYVIPISLAAWFLGRRQGIVASLVSASVWLGADVASGDYYSLPFVPLWNTLIRFSFFAIIALLLAALKRALEHEKELARTDYLTGAANSRQFLESIQMEIDRMQRYGQHPFTMAYIDLDNFKRINDQRGHPAGDQVLRTVVEHAQKNLRRIDVIARLGGDEFALLLPETDPESARGALVKLRNGLLGEMEKNGWPVTFSIGVLTCLTVPGSAEELLRLVDESMYAVKRGSKDAIGYATFPAARE